MKVKRTFDAKTCAALREESIDRWVRPRVLETFKSFPSLNSAVLLVAQFWNDEADDAVHGHIVYSSAEQPDLDAWRAQWRAFRGKHGSNPHGILAEDEESALDWLVEGYDLAIELECVYGERYSMVSWESNHAAIPRFAAFCPEGANQCQDVYEAYTPFAVFRRGADDVRVVGAMVRPWLDGVAGSWAAG